MKKTTPARAWSWIRRYIVWITLIPVLISMLIIFGFSSESAEQSSMSSSGIVHLVIRVCYPDFGEWDTYHQAITTHRVTKVVRKLAHATEYAVFGFFLMLHIAALRLWRSWRRQGLSLPAIGKKIREVPSGIARFSLTWRSFVWTVLLGALYAAADEIHQNFVPGRGPGVADVFLDVAGVVAGAGLLVLIVWIGTRTAAGRVGEKTQNASRG